MKTTKPLNLYLFRSGGLYIGSILVAAKSLTSAQNIIGSIPIWELLSMSGERIRGVKVSGKERVIDDSTFLVG